MKTKIFLNNPNRPWSDLDIRWICFDNKYSIPYKKGDWITWTWIHQKMKEKYGDLYPNGDYKPFIVKIELTKDPFADKTGNQTVVGGTPQGEFAFVQTNA
jgi:hypothetical protein